MYKISLILFSIGLPVLASAVEIDGIVATVDSEPILRSDVINELRHYNSEPSEADFIAARDGLIENKLVLKAAKAAKMTMQDWVIESRLRDIIARNFDGDRNQLMDLLQKQRVSYPEWRQKMVDDMIVSSMRWNTIDRNVIASPLAMKAEYANHPERYCKKAQVTVSVILLSPENIGMRSEVDAALTSKDFAEVARKYSADSHASSGGVWKEVDPKEAFRPEVAEVITAMKVGSTSKWIDLDGWSFLIRKDAASATGQLTFAEAYDLIERNVREELARERYKAWIDRLKAESYIHIY